MYARTHSNYIAFAIHRISGLCLALFLPVHLYVISLLLKDPESLDRFLNWTDTPAVKIIETLLIVFAGAHLAGGIRLLAFEWITISASRIRWIFATAAFSVVCGAVFLLSS